MRNKNILVIRCFNNYIYLIIKRELLMKSYLIILLFFFTFNGCERFSNDILSDEKYVDVVIDAGHGGMDPGAKKGDVNEKDIVLTLCKNIKTQLEKNGSNVLLSRQTDTFVSLDDRVALVNSSNAKILISIHMNTSKNSLDNGITTYYQDNEESKKIAKNIHDELNKNNLFFDNGVHKASNFKILQSTVPSILINLGYLSNVKDLKKMNTIEGQNDIAHSISKAINNYLLNK